MYFTLYQSVCVVIIHLIEENIMSFIVPKPNLPSVPSLIGQGSSGFIGSFGGPGKGGISLSPSFINPSLSVSMNFGGNSNTGKPSGQGNNNPPPTNPDYVPTDGNGKSGKGGRQNSRPGKRNRPFYDLQESNVASVSFSSGIKSGTIINPQEDNTNDNSCLYVLNGQFLPDTKKNSASLLEDYLGKDIYFNYLVDSQARVNYKVDKDFQQSDFLDYIYTLASALQLYYQIDSIITYVSNPANHNRGMLHLRSLINADILSSHAQLKMYLEKLPIPRNLLDYIRYMYQNFTFNDEPNAPIIRLGFSGTLYDCNSIENGKLSPDLYSKIINRLISRSKIISVLSKTYDSTMIGILPPSSNVVLYDKQFLTFWHNSNIVFSDKDRPIVNSIAVNESSDLIQYGTFIDDIDGCIYASASIVLSNTSQPGIWKSFNQFEDDWDYQDRTSLTVFRNNSMVGVQSMNHRIQSGLRSCPYYNGGEWVNISGLTPGSIKVQTHSIENLKQAAALTVRYLITS